MSISHPLPPKKEVALALLERSNDRGILVHLDPREATVVVPPWFKKQPQLVLQIGLNMPVPIPDLRLDEDGMSCTLSFNRSPFFCSCRGQPSSPWSVRTGAGWYGPTTSRPRSRSRGRARHRAAAARSGGGRDSKKDCGPEKATKTSAAKGRRPRKRGSITAVPDAAPPQARKSKAERPVKGEAATAQRPVAAAKRPTPAAGSASQGTSKKKRELPPYLRVVK